MSLQKEQAPVVKYYSAKNGQYIRHYKIEGNKIVWIEENPPSVTIPALGRVKTYTITEINEAEAWYIEGIEKQSQADPQGLLFESRRKDIAICALQS